MWSLSGPSGWLGGTQRQLALTLLLLWTGVALLCHMWNGWSLQGERLLGGDPAEWVGRRISARYTFIRACYSCRANRQACRPILWSHDMSVLGHGLMHACACRHWRWYELYGLRYISTSSALFSLNTTMSMSSLPSNLASQSCDDLDKVPKSKVCEFVKTCDSGGPGLRTYWNAGLNANWQCKHICALHATA